MLSRSTCRVLCLGLMFGATLGGNATLIGASDPIGRESAVRIAGYFGYRETSDAVLGAVSDPVEAVRVAALEHLPFLDDPQVPELLHRALETDTPRAKAAAARALGRIEGDDTGSALVDLLWHYRY